MYKVRKAERGDMDRILDILKGACENLKQQGSLQWQNGFGPGRSDVTADMNRGEAYVLIGEGEVCGYAALTAGVDACYTAITEGRWDDSCNRYISIHRVAVDRGRSGQGAGKQFLAGLIEAAWRLGYQDIRIDTHKQNKGMEHVILHCGFEYKGIVEFPIPDGKRKAYQLVLRQQ